MIQIKFGSGIKKEQAEFMISLLVLERIYRFGLDYEAN